VLSHTRRFHFLQGLHGFVGADRDGVWTIIAGAVQQRSARARDINGAWNFMESQHADEE